ncbi:MAG: tetratricopeptide repeat protein [bacterium]
MSRSTVIILSLAFFLPFLTSCYGTTIPKTLSVRQQFTEGLAYESLSDYSRALDRYRGILDDYPDINPWSQQARLRTARIYNNRLSQPEKAISFYKKFLRHHGTVDETKASVLMELAKIYRGQDKKNEAIDIYKQVVEEFDSLSQVQESYYNLGEIYYEKEQYEKAISSFQSLVDQFPQGDLSDGALFKQAQAHKALEEYNQQLQTLLNLLNNHSDSDLYEYSVFLTIEVAVKLDRKDVGLKWAKKYRTNYSNGKYSKQVYDIVKDKWDVDLQPGQNE